METGEIVVKLAQIKDAELIADLSRATFYESFAADNTPENMNLFMNGPFSRLQLITEVTDTENIFLLAEKQGEIIGYVKMRHSLHSKEMPIAEAIEIARIYVSQRAIGSGVGKRLMEAAINTAMDQKKAVIWLGVWEHNKRAIDFYLKWGFERFGEHIFMLGEDAQTDVLLKKTLQQ
jgi:ribosomal protein S18 acetylase RimI-like enzyme